MNSWKSRPDLSIDTDESQPQVPAIKKRVSKIVYSVITEYDLSGWRQQILDERESLGEKAWIIELDDIWYFSFCKWVDFWPKIGWKSMRYFPTTNFNRQNWIGDEKFWKFRTKPHLIKMFDKLGFTIATPEQENIFKKNHEKKYYESFIPEYRSIIKSSNDILKKDFWIYEMDWVWNFALFKNAYLKKPFNWKNLNFFPFTEFNQYYNIWNSKWRLDWVNDLRRVFQVLWFDTDDISDKKGERIRIPEEEPKKAEKLIANIQTSVEKIAPDDKIQKSKLRINTKDFSFDWKELRIFNLRGHKELWAWYMSIWIRTHRVENMHISEQISKRLNNYIEEFEVKEFWHVSLCRMWAMRLFLEWIIGDEHIASYKMVNPKLIILSKVEFNTCKWPLLIDVHIENDTTSTFELFYKNWNLII